MEQPQPRSLITGGVVPFLQRWTINTLAVLVAVCLLGDASIHYGDWQDLLVASLLLGVLNAVLRPLLLLLSLPLLIFTLGLFTLVINAGLLWLVSELLKPDFHVANFRAAFWGALIISFVSIAVNFFVGHSRVRGRVNRRPPPPDQPGGGSGPVIDV